MLKKLAFVFSTLVVASSAFSAKTVECTGELVGKQSVYVLAHEDEASRRSVSAIFKSLSDPSQAPREVRSNPSAPWEISELTVGFNRFGLDHAHHNYQLKISADADIFGYAGLDDETQTERAYRGKLVLWTGPGDNPQRTIFDVICKKL